MGKILTGMEQAGFVCTELHSRILIPQAITTWMTIHEYCTEDAYTSACHVVSPFTDPSNDYAKSWQFGKYPARRTAHTEGRRLTFYDAHRMHPNEPPDSVAMELQLFGDTAHKFIYADQCRGVDLTVRTIGVIRSFAEFKELTGDSNRSRRPPAEFWQQIVADFSAIHLPRIGKPEPQMENRIKKFWQELFTKKQKLGHEPFVSALAAFIMDQQLTVQLSAILRDDPIYF